MSSRTAMAESRLREAGSEMSCLEIGESTSQDMATVRSAKSDVMPSSKRVDSCIAGKMLPRYARWMTAARKRTTSIVIRAVAWSAEEPSRSMAPSPTRKPMQHGGANRLAIHRNEQDLDAGMCTNA